MVGQVLLNGEWTSEDALDEHEHGRFIRRQSIFRDRVTADGSSGFPAEAGRYHLYVSLACPWAHRTLIVRRLKGLEEVIPVSVVASHMGEKSWHFSDCEGCTPDQLYGSAFLYELYLKARPEYTGIVTVPVLWDRVRETIVNNESSEIIRMLNSEFSAFSRGGPDLYPPHLRDEIDRINDRIYTTVNNGVYRAGFATTQEAYEEAFDELFETLDMLEERLASQRFLVGDQATEADWRLFTTLIRFDAVYHLHFKCNRHRLVDFPNLFAYTCDLYQVPGIAETVNLDHIKNHYYTSHPHINPTGIIPKGPRLDFTIPPGREGF